MKVLIADHNKNNISSIEELNPSFEVEWSWKNTGGTGYLQGTITVLIGGHQNNEEKFDECTKEIKQLLFNISDNSEGE